MTDLISGCSVCQSVIASIHIDTHGHQLRIMAMGDDGKGPFKEESLQGCGITSPVDLKTIETFLCMSSVVAPHRKLTLKSLNAALEDLRCNLNKQIGHERDVRTELEHRYTWNLSKGSRVNELLWRFFFQSGLGIDGLALLLRLPAHLFPQNFCLISQKFSHFSLIFIQ